MRVAMTGGTGFVGGHAAAALARLGHEPVALSRRTGVSVSSETALADAFRGCGAVLHCAGINRELGEQTYEAVHVDGTRRVIAAARAAGVRKIVLMSFLRARPGTGWAYHQSKWEAEELVRRSGLDHTIIKAGVIYGRGDHMLDHLSHALHTFPLFALVGLTERPVRPAAVEDVARILAAAVGDPRLENKTVAATGPEELMLGDAVRRVAEVVGRRPCFFRMPVWLHLALAWLCERAMTVPLVSLAQVRILSEGVAEPAGPVDDLPADLAPTTPFTREQVRRGLPPPGPFGLRDLRCCAAQGQA